MNLVKGLENYSGGCASATLRGICRLWLTISFAHEQGMAFTDLRISRRIGCSSRQIHEKTQTQ